MELIALILSSVSIMLASLVGVFFTIKHLGAWTENNIRYLIAFASGVFLIVAYHLGFEAIEFGADNIFVWIAIILGFLMFFALERMYPEAHCHHGDQKCMTENNKKGARKILIGDAFHNLADGILLAPIFVADIKLGIVAAFGIFVHEIVQEISEFFVLKNAGYSTKKALTLNFLVSGTILIGAIGGYYLSSFVYLVGPLIGFAGGAFVYILLIDLIPESIKHSHKEKKYFNYIAWALFGILLILSINFFTHG